MYINHCCTHIINQPLLDVAFQRYSEEILDIKKIIHFILSLFLFESCTQSHGGYLVGYLREYDNLSGGILRRQSSHGS